MVGWQFGLHYRLSFFIDKLTEFCMGGGGGGRGGGGGGGVRRGRGA